MIKGAAHIGLYIEDMERSKKFYTEVLGFRVASQTEMEDGTLISMVQLNDCVIELVQLPDYRNPGDGLFNHIALMVDDIGKAHDELKSKGVVFEADEPAVINVFGGVKYYMFRGPDGEHLEIDQML